MKPARCLALLVPALSMLLAGACAPVSGPILAATPTPAAAMVEASVPVPLSPAAPPSPSPAASPALDSLTIALGSEPDTLHPLLGGWTERTIQAAIFSACTRENEKMEWAPEMCEQVPTLANGGAAWVGDGDQRHLEVTFRLRPDWRWHDGTAVTAADYVYTWNGSRDDP